MNIAAYCRVSTDHEEQLSSLESQRAFFKEYAEKNQHHLVHVYADEGISGTSLKKRANFLKLMADAKLGLFEMVVVKDVSRFARNTVDFLQSIRALKAMGINTIFLTANMDSLGDSEFILTIFSAMAQEESANLSKRVKFGKQVNAKRGRVPNRIFGYERADNYNLIINPIEAEIIKKIFRMYVHEGLGCRKIAIQLNNDGASTKLGSTWNGRQVRRVLTNETYAGTYINNKYEVGDYLTGKLVRRPESQHLRHERPEWAIVSREDFDAAQAILGERRETYKNQEVFRGARYSNKHIFSTLIKCGKCGGSYARKHYTNVSTRIYWKCRTNDQQTASVCDNIVKIEEDELLDAVKDYLSSIVSDKDAFVKRIVSSVTSLLQTEDASQQIEQLQAQKEKLEKQLRKLQDLYINDIISMDELKAKTSAINGDVADITYRLHQLNATSGTEEAIAQAAAHYASEVERFLSLETITNEDMRKVIDHILVDPDGTVTIHIKKFA